MAVTTDFAAQDLIDEEIAAEIQRHKEHLQALKIRRNAHCAVNKLPSDVLTYILLFCKLHAEAISSEHDAFSRHAYSQWIVLLRVCHSWHDHIMQTPRFWSTINLYSPQAWNMFARSKAALLRVQGNSFPRTASPPWPLVQHAISQSPRLQHLSLYFSDCDALSQALTLIPPDSSAPRLVQLEITVEEDLGEFYGRFWENLPSLRSLSLDGFPLPLIQTHTIRCLTHLRIGPSSLGVAIPWLLRALEALPNIEDLDISDLNSPLVGSDFPSVSLPHLSVFRVASYDFSTLSILDYLVVPSSSRIELAYGLVETTDLQETDLHALKNAMMRFVSSASSVNAVKISFDNVFEITVYLPDDIYDPPDFGTPSIYCALPILPGDDTRTLLRLCKLIPLHKTSILTLFGFTATYVGKGYLSFIPSSSSLHTLILDSCSVQVLQQLVMPRNVVHPPNPELECIHFIDTAFHNKKGRYNMYITLGNILRERKRRMMSIQMVALEGCDIESWAVRGLEQLVEVQVL
ncbi:hypothetical protein ONZ45_g3079 [Pleurotus djamor]|nr:hypothetical protein ONZ45_g3079 [Pleurotus djamor]